MMSTENAFNIIEEACAGYIGNLNAHKQIQAALEIIKGCVFGSQKTEGEKLLEDSLKK